MIVDGTPDVSHTEQITFVLRYVHKAEDNVWAIKERLLLFEDCEKNKGKDIANLLCIVLQRNGIDLQHCRGQGYDNGSNMSGIYNGVQALILEKIHKPSFVLVVPTVSTFVVSMQKSPVQL